ncbi:MAG: flagellar basal-body rod protein FlgG [Firmicutes bacterium]|nr:flagellar basal-body rod protein FlgG [Bacillota bacterium]
MIRALWTASSGMNAQQTNIDIISNNLANVNTVGFKKSRAQFQDLLYQTIRAAGTTTAQGNMNPSGLQIGHGVRMISSSKSYGQGDVIQTGNALDLMIEGDGFFQVMLPDGNIGYTRDGNFKVDGEGRIVNNDGYVLQPEIWVPENATEIIIGTDGTVSVRIAGEQDPQEIGMIELVRFLNPEGLVNIGRNIVLPSNASGEPQYGTAGLDGFGNITQGFLEMSNVKVVEEMVNLIVAQRAYEVNSKAIQAADEMLQTANNLRR